MVEEKQKSEGLGISGFNLGILAVIFSGWTGLIVGIIGAVLCFAQQKKHKTKLGKIGLILNIVAVILSITIIILYATVLAPLLAESGLA